MEIKKTIKKVFVACAALTVLFAFTPAQAVEEVKIEGVIVSRDGSNVLVHSGTGSVNLTINEATKVQQTKLLGIFWEEMPADKLIPGLSIRVWAEPNDKQTLAKRITFDADDLQRASEIQAALAVPQKEAAALQDKVKQQEQIIATQEEQIAANKQKIAEEQAAVDKRFSDIADYDIKKEINILFDRNSAKLSEQGKKDLQALAAEAKKYKGYLIQVAGYASSTGTPELNQNLSDRRAESVVTYLRQYCDVGISRVLAPVAMSSSKPVASNETEQGRAENRRVVVKIAVNRAIGE
jgi:OOP family OmpA-OmpF porin